MRCGAVRDAIVTAIEAITPDHMASKGDLFRAHDFETPGRDRAFRVDRISPQAPSAELMTTLGSGPDAYEVAFELSVIYLDGPGTTDRRLADGDRCIDALRAIPGDHTQIRHVDISGSADNLDPGGFWLTSWDLLITYDRRDP